LEIVRTVFFFHPPVHWLLGRIEYERELLCDEAAVAQGIDPREYASVLLEFSRQPGRLRAAFVGPAYLLGFGHSRSVKARINRLLEANMNRWMSPLPIRRAIGLGMVALALALALGSFGVRTIETRADTESSTAKLGLVASPEDADKAKNIEPGVMNRVAPYSVLKIRALGVDPAKPIDGEYLVEPSGKIDLGPAYGKVAVAGLRFEEAEIVVQKLLKEMGFKDVAVSLTLAGWVTKWRDDPTKKAPYHIRPLHLLKIRVLGGDPTQQLGEDYLVEPGGKVSLGPAYGRVVVAGLTLEEAQMAIENHLKKLGFAAVKASVTLAGWQNGWLDLTKEDMRRQDKKPSKAEPSEKSLSYGAKNFAEWKAVLTNDLKPEVRVEAIKALSAFGTSGYGQEASEAIINVMRSYDVARRHPYDEQVIDAAFSAFRKIGSEGASPLINELKNGNLNGRRFAITALAGLGRITETAVPTVIEAFKDQDFYIRHSAIGSAYYGIDTHSRLLVPALTQALLDPEPGIKILAANQLRQMRHNARSAVPALVAALKDENPEVRFYFLQVLQDIGPKTQEVLPALIVALKDKEEGMRRQALQYLQALGPEARDAVPALIAGFNANPSDRQTIAGVLGTIGPPAKKALPTLIEFLQQPEASGSETQKVVQEALRKINK
jgi:HEAT repeat protein/protein involved in polysaccharide export with SLBB domain